MKRRPMAVAQLLQERQVDLLGLPPAPAAPPMRAIRDRITLPAPWPCVVCGDLGATARVLDTEDGSRWLDLCWDHSTTVQQPSPGMPTTMEGIVTDLRAAAEAAGAPLTILTDNDFQDHRHGAGPRPPHG